MRISRNMLGAILIAIYSRVVRDAVNVREETGGEGGGGQKPRVNFIQLERTNDVDSCLSSSRLSHVTRLTLTAFYLSPRFR